MELLRKIFASSVIFVTVLSMSVVAAPAGAAAKAGDLIKMDGLSTVYYLGADGKRYVFPNEKTYMSWYKDFSTVVTIAQSELESMSLGGNVTVRPGTKLVKITTNPTVYAVEPGGSLKSIVSEANAIALWGANWAQRVIDVPDGFFTNYKVGTALTAGVYPVGSLVKTSASADVYYFDGTNYRKFTGETALLANGFDMANVVTSTGTVTAGGAQIAAAEATLTNAASGAVAAVVGGTGLTVAISANTASAATLIVGQSIADLATFNFTAANDGAVTVTTLKLKRTGISSDATLSNVYLYDGNTKLTDAGSFSSGALTFNNAAGIFTVMAGQAKSISVKGDVAAGSGNTIGVSVNAASDVVASGASVSGSFPATGNTMSVATPDSNTLGTATISTSSVATTVDAGTVQAIVWAASMNVGVKASNLKYISLKNIGTITSDSLANIKLFVNGEQAGSATTIDANSNVNFDLSAAPLKLEVGTQTLEVRADVVKGSSRNFKFSLQTAADMVLTETGYGVNITVGGTIPTTPASATTISIGKITITKDTTFTTSNIVKGTAGATLAKFTLKAYGEDMKVTTLGVTPNVTGATTTEGLTAVSLYVNNLPVGSAKNYIATAPNTFPATPLTFGTTNLFTILAGATASLEIRADLTQNASSSMSAVQADLVVATGAFQGLTSVQTSPASPTTYTGQTGISITAGNLTIAKTASVQDKNILANTVNAKIGSYTLQAGSAEGVKVTNIAIGLTGTAALTELNNIYISENTTPLAPQTSNNFSVNFTIPANGSKVIDVFADVNAVNTGSTTITTIVVTAYGATTNKSVGGTATGQTMTVQVGSLATPTLVSNVYPSALVVGGATTPVAQYKFVATNGDASISELTFNITQAATSTKNTSAANTITVDGKSGTVACAEGGTTCTAKITGLAIAVPAGITGKTVDVSPTFNAVMSSGQGGSLTRNEVRLDLVKYKYTIGSTNPETATNVASNVMVLVASAPVVAKASTNPVSVGSGAVADASMEVMHFTVTIGAGQNAVNLKNIGFKPTYTALSSSTQLLTIYDKANISTALGTAQIGASGAQGTLALTSDFTINPSTSATFVLKADTTGAFGSNGNSFRIDLAAAGDTATSTGTNWQWNDGTTASYGNGYLVKELPITGSTFTK